jgi:Putative DNA-binding domain
MSLQHLNISQICGPAVQALVDSSASESKTLEFKQDLQVVTDEQKREFLSDVTALANSDGGDIIFGIGEDKGVAVEVIGLRNFVPDDRIGQLENLLRDFVQPRLSGVQFLPRALANGSHVLIVRVPRSFAAPHMVRHQGVTRFCGRNSNGKYDLDVHELRSAFLGSEGLSDRLRSFRLDRVNKLISGNAPVTLSSPHLSVFHLLPIASARPDLKFPGVTLKKILSMNAPQPFGVFASSARFNIDGILLTAERDANAFEGYVQVFRNGFLEAVDSSTIGPNGIGGYVIPGIVWEKRILDGFQSYQGAMETLDLPRPFVASVSLLNVRGFKIDPQRAIRGREPSPVDRDHLLSDEVLIEPGDEDLDVLLRPLFDQIWNGCGWAQSLNYGGDGKRRDNY